MTQMSSSGHFVPKEYEVDYEQEPCYAHYGLKHGADLCTQGLDPNVCPV